MFVRQLSDSAGEGAHGTAANVSGLGNPKHPSQAVREALLEGALALLEQP